MVATRLRDALRKWDRGASFSRFNNRTPALTHVIRAATDDPLSYEEVGLQKWTTQA